MSVLDVDQSRPLPKREMSVPTLPVMAWAVAWAVTWSGLDLFIINNQSL